MLQFKRLWCVAMLLMVFFINLSSVMAEWVSFGRSSEKQKPVARVIVSNDRETVIEFTLEGMEVKEITRKGEAFHILRFPEYFTTMEIGRPQLPAIAELVGIPDQSNVRVSVVETDEIILTGYHVYPYQEPRLENEAKPFVIERSFYESNVFYPDLNAKLSTPRIWRDVRVVTLKTYPVKFNPATGDLRISRRMVVRLEYSGISDTNVFTGPRKLIKQEWDKLYRNTILNYDFLVYEKAGKSLNKMNSSNGYDYLIITVDQFYDNIYPLAQWKTMKGMKSNVVKLSTIGENPDQTDIKEFIQEEYDNTNNNISYVLLVGDDDELPLASGGSYPDYWDGDYWYSDLTGEFPSEAELKIGRISAVSDDEVDLIVDKILSYELKPPLTYIGDDIWVKRSLLIADDDTLIWDDVEKEWVPLEETYEECKQAIFNSHNQDLAMVTAYGSGYPDINNQFVTDKIEEGIGLVNYRGHGGSDSWWHWSGTLDYTKENASGLQNDVRTPVVFSIACQTAMLQSASETLAEAFCKNESGGAVAFLGATDDTRTYANHFYDKELYNAFFKTEPLYQIGAVSNYAVVRMLACAGQMEPVYTSDEAKWNAKRYLWLGDPATEVWTDTPSSITGIQITDYGDYIEVTVGTGPYNIYVCSGDNGSSYFDKLENVSGSKNFETPVRPLYVTVTKHNHIPYTAIVGGTFTSNEYWFGNLNVLASVIFEDNSQLTILPGTEVVLHGNYNISVRHDSKILAQGTESEHIVFEPAGGTNWRYLYINGSYNRLEWCDFKNGQSVMLRAYKPGDSGYKATDNIVRNCTFENMSQWALYTKMDSLVTVENCDMEDNHHAVFCDLNNDVVFSGNHIRDSEKDGIYSKSGNFLDFEWNVIENSGVVYSNTSGIYTSYSDVIRLGWIYEALPGYNTIRNNHNNGVYAGYGNPSVYIFYSSIHDNDSYEIKNYSGNDSTVETWWTWWGTSPHFIGNYELNYPIYAIPEWDGSTSGGTGKSIAQGMNTTEGASYGDDRERIEQLKEIIANQPNTTEANEALIELYALLRMDYHEDKLNEKDGFYSYLEEIYQKHRDKKLGKLAQEKKIFWKSLEGDFSTAIEISKKALEEFTGEERMCVLGNLATYYLQTDQLEEAKECLNEYKEKYAFDENGILCMEEEIALYEWEVSEGFRENKDKNLPEQITTSGIATLDLFQNYPNPGNPTTTIRFQLPVADHVTLKIYNILGREVRNLVDGHREAGDYTVIWDGKNNRGIEMPSGVYLYTIHVREKVFTRKLILVR